MGAKANASDPEVEQINVSRIQAQVGVEFALSS
jgi:hypothetical protein